MKNIYLLTYFKALLLFVVGLMCSYQLYGQTFMENFDDDPAFNVTSKDFTNDGIRYQINGLSSNYTNATSNSTFSLSEDGAADYALQFDKGGSFNINSIVISLGSGQVFSLQSISFDIIADAKKSGDEITLLNTWDCAPFIVFFAIVLSVPTKLVVLQINPQ